MPKILTYSELRDYGVVYTRAHLDRLERAGKFPRRVPIGEFRIGWVEKEITDYVVARVEARSTDKGALGSTGKIRKRERSGRIAGKGV